MATSKPRITLTMEPELYALYRELAELQGRSMSAIIVDLLDATSPVQQQVLEALRRVLSVQEEGRTDMLASLEKAQAQAEGMLSPAMAIFDEFLAGQPPHSNTGVTTQSQQAECNQKNPAKPSKPALSAVKTTKQREGGR